MSLLKLYDDLIDIKSPLLSIKELLNKLNYDYNLLFLDKFWNNIKDNIWIYIDETMLKYIGYSEIDLNSSKRTYLLLLKDNFDENIDFKLLNSKDFLNNHKCVITHLENININTHNKTKHLIISPDCFKQSLMLLKTNKSKEIKKYYIELEKVFKLYLEYQNKYKELELENKLNDTIQNIKLDKHKYLIEKFNYKQCIYIIEVNINNINKLIKIGSTKNIKDRIFAMNASYTCECILLDIYECENNYKEIEQYILTNNEIKQNLYKEKINNVMPKEIVKLSDTFNYEQLIHIIKDNIKKNVYLNPFQLLEKQKLDLINKLLDKGYNPNLFENFTINIIIKEDKKCKCKNNIESEINNENKLDINNEVEPEINNKNKPDINDEEPKNFSFKIKNTRGRKIQKINPNNLNNIVQIYDSMIHVLRSNDGVSYTKGCIQHAIKYNRIYKGFRWCFVEKGEDPNISKARPTDTTSTSRITEPIAKLNINKNEIINIYNNQEECFLNNGLTKVKLKELIVSNKLYNNVYFVKISDCNSELLHKYNIDNAFFKKQTKSKSIIAINPLTNEETIFKTISEIPIKLGGTSCSINSAIKNKTIYNGYFWKIKE